MLLEDTAAIEAELDIPTDDIPFDDDKPTKWIAATPLEEAYMWKKANKHRIVGKLSPCTKSGEGSRAPVAYDFILPDSAAVAYLNGFCDRLGIKPRTRKQWQKWIKFWSANPLPDGPLSTKTKLPKTPRF